MTDEMTKLKKSIEAKRKAAEEKEEEEKKKADLQPVDEEMTKKAEEETPKKDVPEPTPWDELDVKAMKVGSALLFPDGKPI